MNRDPILFRVDGTTRTGWERLYRCLTLAAALQRRRRPTYFLSELDPALLALTIKRAGNDWLGANHPAGTPEDVDETVQQLRRLHAAAVVVDVPDTREDYLAQLRAAGAVVVSLDHQASIRFTSRLIINPLLGPSKEAYEFDRGTQLLVGARYALVRPEVRRARPLRSQEPPQPFRIMVALGDDDPHGQTMELTRLLMNCPRVGRVDAVVRPQHPALEQLQAMAEASPGRFEVATEPAEVTARLSRCHLAMTAGNSWSLELACVGVPQLLVVQNEAHWPTARAGGRRHGHLPGLARQRLGSDHSSECPEPVGRRRRTAGHVALRPASDRWPWTRSAGHRSGSGPALRSSAGPGCRGLSPFLDLSSCPSWMRGEGFRPGSIR